MPDLHGRIARSAKLSQMLAIEGVFAAIISKPQNIRYLSDFRGEGLLVFASQKRIVVTDFRYAEQAQNEAQGFMVAQTSPTQSYEDLALELILSETSIESSSIAIEEDAVSVLKMKKFEKKASGRTFVGLGKKVEKLREIKDETEIASIEKACLIACEAFESILTEIKPGRTEREIAWILECAMHDRGAEKPSFATIIASGANGSLPHAIPSAKKIASCEFVTLDFGCVVDGYCSDITRTVALGQISSDMRMVYDTVLTAQLTSLDAVHDGAVAKQVDAVARDIINNAGYEGRFGHGLGHSLGLDIHEDPRFSQTMPDDKKVYVNMLMTVEPGIYIPGSMGVRIEDTVLVTKSCAKRLTPTTKELIVL